MYMYSVHVCTAVWHLLGQLFVKVIPFIVPLPLHKMLL